MYYLGCDLGSTTGKAVVLDVRDGTADIAAWSIEPSGLSPEETAATVVSRACARLGIDRDNIAGACCTGYGREHVGFIPRNMSEISCHARGAHLLRPGTRTIIDVGGQDVKAISVSGKGRVVDFTMNDKCAAGTGRFFEMMARVLRVSIAELGQMSLRSQNPAPISSTCSVFAESEVISCINKGISRDDIAGGIHVSIARRLTAMVSRVGLAEELVLTGGCAKNPGLRRALADMLGVKPRDLPCDPQVNGALGAALYASDEGGWLSSNGGSGLVLGRIAAPDPRDEARTTTYSVDVIAEQRG
ncbi:CoA activase [bacterium]|nr:CoA activase [bacterium]